MAKEFTPEEHRAWLETLHSIPAGAAMLLEDPEGRLLVVKANYRRHWTLPGGVIDENESPKEAAIREAHEEVGLTIRPESTEFVGVAYRKHPTMRDTYQFIFKAYLDLTMAQSVILQESEIEAYDFIVKEQVGDDDRLYAPIIHKWANGTTAYYDEQVIGD